MSLYLYSQIKPQFYVDSNGTFYFPYNKLSEQLFVLSNSYKETYETSQVLDACYQYNSQFLTLNTGNNWLILVSFILLTTLTYIKVQFPLIFKQIIISLFNFQYARQLVNEKSGLVQRASFFLLALYLMSFSFFLFLSSLYFNVQLVFVAPLQLALIFLVIILFFLLKVGLYKGMAFLVDQQEKNNLFLAHFSVFYRNLAIFLTPLVVVLPFIHYKLFPYFFYGIFIILLLFTFLRLYRAFLLSFQFNFSFVHIFLYLCTVEMVPLIYGIKLLYKWVL